MSQVSRSCQAFPQLTPPQLSDAISIATNRASASRFGEPSDLTEPEWTRYRSLRSFRLRPFQMTGISDQDPEGAICCLLISDSWYL